MLVQPLHSCWVQLELLTEGREQTRSPQALLSKLHGSGAEFLRVKKAVWEKEGAHRSMGVGRAPPASCCCPVQTSCGLVSSRHLGSVRMDLMLLSGYLGFHPQGKHPQGVHLKDEMYSPLKTDCPWRLTPTFSSRSTTPNPVLEESRWPKPQGYC